MLTIRVRYNTTDTVEIQRQQTSCISARSIGLLCTLLLDPVASNRLRGNLFLLNEEFDQRLHWLHLLISHKLVVLCDCNKVHKAHIQNFMLVDMEERILPMAMVEMRIAAKHLLHYPLAILVKCLREATVLSNPVLARKCAERRIEVCWSGSDGRPSSRSANVARCVSCSGCIRCFGREHHRIVDLADDPLLHAVDKLRRRDLGSPSVYEPSIRKAMGLLESIYCGIYEVATYRPADMVGHDVSLQIGRPVTPLVS